MLNGLKVSTNKTPNSDKSGNAYYDITVEINVYAVIDASFDPSSTGEAHVFKYNLATDNWDKIAHLKPNNGYSGSLSLLFGLLDILSDVPVAIYCYISSNYFWASLMLLSIDITSSIHDYTYVVIGGSDLSHTKSEWKFNSDEISNNEYLLAVEIDYNCNGNTNLEMILSDNYNGGIDTDTGCYRVTFSDCDDSLTTYRTHDHEFYAIIVGHHGYYTESGAAKKIWKNKARQL